MPDTWKTRASSTPIPSSHYKRVYTNGILTYDSGLVNEGSEFSTTSSYATTERNCKKNGGKWPPKLKSIASSIQLVPVGKGRKVPVYNSVTKKTDWVIKPLLVPRIVRKNIPLDPKIRAQTLTNDLVYTEHWPGGYGTGVFYLGDQTGPNTVITRYDGSPKFAYQDYGIPFTQIPNVQATTLPSRYASLIAEVSDESVRKLYDYIKKQPADLGTDLAEGMQTIRMFSDISRRLAEFLVAIKQLKLSKITDELRSNLSDKEIRRLTLERKLLKTKAINDLLPTDKKKLANDFLAYRYGISPLINDIIGLQKEISDHLSSNFRYKATGRSRRVVEGSNSYVEVQVKHYCLYSISDQFMDELSRLGLTNPINVAWELVPWSFVVDWLLPIGPYLNKLTTLDHLTVKSVHRTIVIREALWHDEPSPVPDVAPYYWHTGYGGYNWQVGNLWVSRTVLSDIPSIPVPTFKSPFSTGHVANFIALLTQALTKR